MLLIVTAPVAPESPMPRFPCKSDVTPVLVMVSPLPMTDCPAVTEMPVPFETVPVATFAKVFGPEKYGMFPTTAGVEVERPLKLMVLIKRTSGHAKARGTSGVAPEEAAVMRPFPFTVMLAFVKEPTLAFTVASVAAAEPGPLAVTSPVSAVM